MQKNRINTFQTPRKSAVWLFFAVFFLSGPLAAQTPATVQAIPRDSVKTGLKLNGKLVKPDTSKSIKWAQRKDVLQQVVGIKPIKPENRPTVAFLRAAVPGMGQYTNKQYVKMGVVITAATGGVLTIMANRSRFRYYRDIIRDPQFANTNTYTFVPAKPLYSDEGLAILASPRDMPPMQASLDRLTTVAENYRRWRDLSVIGFAVGYFLSGIEAYVAAHLKGFDLGDDITATFKPAYIPTNTGVGAVGVRFAVQFNSPKKVYLLK